MAIDIEIGHVFFFFAPGMGIRMQKMVPSIISTPRNVFASLLAIYH